MKTKNDDRNIKNCPNCGAPLNEHGHCEYCGSKRQLKSEMVITATEIRLTCG